MKRNTIIGLIICAIILAFIFYRFYPVTPKTTSGKTSWWQVQSIDTMKYSRDLSGAKLNDPTFDAVIDTQVKNIADMGATHVAIATPYDEEFVPFLSRWVAAARKYKLNVWFRGNFSGWEKWFDYKGITRDEHLKKTTEFIVKHPNLFMDGDIFSPCPECENGGPGDPRKTGDVEGHRLFLTLEYQRAQVAFQNIGKNVETGFNSMNFDVARAVMDKKTTEALGGVVVIDHYVSSPEKLVSDVQVLEQQTGGKIFLGEFGVPIPDINGKMTETQQAEWIRMALTKLVDEPSVIGLNYWVGVGGSTQIWNDDGTPRQAVSSITSFFSPRVIHGTVVNIFNRPIKDIEVFTSHKNVKTDLSGQFNIPVVASDTTLFTNASGYKDAELTIDKNSNNVKIIIEKTDKNLFEKFLDRLHNLFF